MATLEFYLTGDQLGLYSSLTTAGKNSTRLLINGVSPLGTIDDTYRVVIEGADEGCTDLSSGQTITVYSWPDGEMVYSGAFPSSTYLSGSLLSGSHLISGGTGGGLYINADGVTAGTNLIGPGNAPAQGIGKPFPTFPPKNPHFPCLAKGTLIETDIGPLPIETLRLGDKVATFDNGLQKIKWIGKREVPASGQDAPIVFEPGAMGNYRRLTVSPQHRMVMNDWRTEMYFGQPEVLVAAVHLVNGTTIRQVSQPKITWYHMLFERHEIIFAEGIRTESLHLGAEALGRLDPVSRAQILALYPEGRLPNTPTARPCLKAYETALVPAERKTGLRSSAA